MVQLASDWMRVSEISPFQSPYKHWRSGLLMEIAVTASFMGLLVVIGLVLARLL